MKLRLAAVAAAACAAASAYAATQPAVRATAKAPPSGAAYQEPPLADRLGVIREQVLDLESRLVSGLKTQREAKTNVKKIQDLLRLQRQEGELGRRREAELGATIEELEERRGTLAQRIEAQRKQIHRFLVAINSSSEPLDTPEREQLEAPRRKLLANLVDRGVKEIEALRADVSDADKLEEHIQDEKQQLTYLFQDLREQEGVLELNRQLQVDLLRKKRDERVAQLENYRRLKSAESQVERLIGEFNARMELERATETERLASKAMNQGVFARLKGRLPLPISGGRVVSGFGRAFDAKSQLYIFKKGVDIASGKNESVRAISAGKIAYSGELPDYGRVAIVDHGDHFYSLCAHLGVLTKKAGDPVAAGDTIGVSDDSGTPVYFEIRARNVAVNPLQWIAN